ncbi:MULTISPECIES: hypothetical protein [Paraburkholderia]|uniref:hypothetical protein n=1 Tax=Paraburkholderia TaxID=1822464 RepID=UPI00225C3CD6|nr:MULTISPECIES: hypothetical protein [Paraburkholderia]MCX4176792.1 hypothetical protein [Paraburkholderia madseniana]MDQ6464783.1 hypothetical protein [Paraburkholderia madseniana]
MLEDVWEWFRCTSSDLFDLFKEWLLKCWLFIGTPTVGVLLTAIPAALAAYFTLQASLRANETSERSLQVSQASQKLAEAAEIRQQRENSAAIFARLDKEKCWQETRTDANCRFFFTLSNAGKNTAAHVVTIARIAREFAVANDIEDLLGGDLPSGQVATYSSREFPLSWSPEQGGEVVLAVAFEDSTSHTCGVKSWAFRPEPAGVQNGSIDFVGATDEHGVARNAEAEATRRLQSELGNGACSNLS